MREYKLENLYDVVVIGGGPAGLTAALYLARAHCRVLVVEKEHFGGQITITEDVVNYPGVLRASGTGLTETMRQQAQNFGAEFLLAEAQELELAGDVKRVRTSRGDRFCFGILLATGASPRMVGFEGEAAFRGRGVAYCATCDGEFFAGRDVFVVGGGYAAAEESVFLTKYARQVTILMRGADFSCAAAVAEKARNHEKIMVLPHTVVEAVGGDTALGWLCYRNTETGQVTQYRPPVGESFGVFVFAGYQPASEILEGLAERDAQGCVVTDRNQKTSAEGLYAAGDVCAKTLRQVVTAVSDGAVAATELEKYAVSLQQKTGLHPVFPGVPEQRPAPAAVPSLKASPEPQAAQGQDAGPEGPFDAAMVQQLQTVFSRMGQPLVLRLYLDGRPVSRELEGYMETLAALTDCLTVEKGEGEPEEELPCVRVCRADGTDTGLAFHGVPGGHEFTSFVLGLYNAAGPGQSLDPREEQEIRALDQPLRMQVLVSLSCTMCPELVTAAQRIASLNPQVTAEVYDLNHFPQLRDRYQVMSVPCLVLNGSRITFGKKNVRQLLDWLAEGKA